MLSGVHSVLGVFLSYVDNKIYNFSNTLVSSLHVPIHTVIVDCAPISFLDAMGVKTLQQVRSLY